MNRNPQRKKLVDKLETLLDVPGVETPWVEIEPYLARLPVPTLQALVYRVERAIGNAHDEGFQHGSRDDEREITAAPKPPQLEPTP